MLQICQYSMYFPKNFSADSPAVVTVRRIFIVSDVARELRAILTGRGSKFKQRGRAFRRNAIAPLLRLPEDGFSGAIALSEFRERRPDG